MSASQTSGYEDGESMSETMELSKIDQLRGAVEGLIPVYEELTVEQKARRKFDEERVIREQKKADVVHEKLEVEIVARTEADLALEKLAQTSLSTMQQLLTKPIEEGLTEVKDELNAAHQRLSDAEAALQRNVEETETGLVTLRAEVLDRLGILKLALDKEKKTRKEADEKLDAYFPEIFKELREEMLIETQKRQEAAHELRLRMRALETSEASLEAMAQRQIRQETADYAAALNKEEQDRIGRLIEVATTVDQYNLAIKHGLKIVNRSDPFASPATK